MSQTRLPATCTLTHGKRARFDLLKKPAASTS